MKIKRFENINESKSFTWTKNKFQKLIEMNNKIKAMEDENII